MLHIKLNILISLLVLIFTVLSVLLPIFIVKENTYTCIFSYNNQTNNESCYAFRKNA